MATYVYCIVASPNAPRTAGAPAGLPGTRKVRAIEIDTGLFAIVADALRSKYSSKAINAQLSNLKWVSRAAMRHEAVVEHFSDSQAALPMKLFTIFDDDERARVYLHSERRRFRSLARRVAGHHEWGVRVLLDRQKAIAAHDGKPPSGSRATTGRDYLSRKKAARDASVELASRARETVADLYDTLASRARIARRRSASDLPPDGGSLLLDAAFLVPRSRSASFRALAAKHAKALAPHGYAVTLTGPWPPYTFVQD
jgi:hypothetical protein